MSLFEILCSILTEDGWNYKTDSKNQILRLEIQGVNAAFFSFLIVDDEQESLLCNTHIKLRVPKVSHLEVCEFINRVNYELANGNLEMDMEDGEIRFRTYLDLSGADPSKEQILNLIWNGVQSFDNYYPGLTKIIYNRLTPEQSIRFCDSYDQGREAYSKR